MSNLETKPPEVACSSEAGPHPEILRPRSVPLGGPRAMTVRRTLPQRGKTLIGAWCFLDHYGPDDVAATGGMRVPGHPHTGLQTVSWLFDGEIEHRDTTGVHADVRPGELNLMTAGAGIAHSEYSAADTAVLHGVQLWVALPAADRFTEARFDHYVPPVTEHEGVQVRVFLGDLHGEHAPVPTYSPLLGAEISLLAGKSTTFDVEPAYEHGVLVDTGQVRVGSVSGVAGDLVYHPPGTRRLSLVAADDAPARVLLLGGEPLGEQIVMWWNFIGRSHDEIVQFREQWQAERSASVPVEQVQYGDFPAAWEETLAAPPMPNARLRLRD